MVDHYTNELERQVRAKVAGKGLVDSAAMEVGSINPSAHVSHLDPPYAPLGDFKSIGSIFCGWLHFFIMDVALVIKSLVCGTIWILTGADNVSIRTNFNWHWGFLICL
jgi:hypothetical protein